MLDHGSQDMINNKQDTTQVKEIVDYPNYLIHSDGRIQNKKRKTLLRGCVNTSGYVVITLRNDKQQKSRLLHRLLALHFITNPDSLCVVDHINRDKTDNRLQNLRWVTSSTNNINKAPKANSTGYRHIGNSTRRSASGTIPCWRITIRRNKKMIVNRYLNKETYSLEDTVCIRNQIYRKYNIQIDD